MKEGSSMHCSACGQAIDGSPLIFGPLVLCPQGCVPVPRPDLSAQVERYALEAARKAAQGRYRR
jgi:hypothetical protein